MCACGGPKKLKFLPWMASTFTSGSHLTSSYNFFYICLFLRQDFTVFFCLVSKFWSNPPSVLELAEIILVCHIPCYIWIALCKIFWKFIVSLFLKFIIVSMHDEGRVCLYLQRHMSGSWDNLVGLVFSFHLYLVPGIEMRFQAHVTSTFTWWATGNWWWTF